MAVTLLITGYYRHPKMVAANRHACGELAEVLWTRALDHVNEHGTDGFIAAGIPDLLCPKKTAGRVAALVAAGLWDVVDGGWHVHNWSQWNRSAAELQAIEDAKRKRKSEAGKKGAQVRWGGRLAPAPDSNGHGSSHSRAMAKP